MLVVTALVQTDKNVRVLQAWCSLLNIVRWSSRIVAAIIHELDAPTFSVPSVAMQACWHYKNTSADLLYRKSKQESFCYISNSSLVSNHNISFCFERGQIDWLKLLAVIKLQLGSLFPAVDSVTKSSYLLSQLRKRSRFSSAKLQTAAPNDLQFWMGILSITVSKAPTARSA